ncbi:MAG: Uma2 family endonuclease [Cyanomargarita calcarea GSE-NOS-MK-12-04C]|jgi:Uma2 family endonuclease|uniref:Uma2 family endonuclease n=1 Tax=Cyanomargarita calcarea GSE-NOS-MK-12-04C TaxID=2839659 RepID=A0A951QUB8_9CYAN|nr:Uma2 family endonuclease [Cyanomargarita calcarea GSE-NOS-MK-12-04C]
MNTITLNIPNLSAKGFVELCEANQNLQLERAATGEVIVMPPTYPWTGKKNFSLIGQLDAWNERTGLGIGFDSSTGFTLSNGAVKSPDVSWVSNQQWDALTQTQQQQEFSPVAPDFVVELRSESDSLKKLQEKMQEYIDNGVRLGWLIDPKTKTVEIYRQGCDVEVLQSPYSLSGEDVLPGFELNLNKIW